MLLQMEDVNEKSWANKCHSINKDALFFWWLVNLCLLFVGRKQLNFRCHLSKIALNWPSRYKTVADPRLRGQLCKLCDIPGLISPIRKTSWLRYLVWHKYQEATHDQYVAGLWRSSLERQLCWKVNDDRLEASPKDNFASYQAPSWSWASTDQPVSRTPWIWLEPWL